MIPGDFAQQFEALYSGLDLPVVYRDFILSGAYLKHQRAAVRGLTNYGPGLTPIDFASPRLLDLELLYEGCEIEDGQAEGFHPVAIIPESSQFLAIATTDPQAPVYLYLHETGHFERQFDSFQSFQEALTR